MNTTVLYQIHLKLLILAWIASVCLATEKKPYYESLYDPENIFHVEDYHADLVLGMLPEIKTSIKGFRKRNFTRHDIENMYQTLTIFWPVVRKYLHLKEQIDDTVPSQSNQNYTQNINNEIGQSQISQSSSLPYKNDQLISPHVKADSVSTSSNQRAIVIPISSISALSKNNPNSPSTQQNSNRRNFGVKINRIRPSLPINDNKRNIQRMYSNRNIQSKTTAISQSVTTTGRPFKPTSNIPLATTRNIQSKTTANYQSVTTTGRPFKPTSNIPLSTTTRRPFKLIRLKHLSTTHDSPFNHTSLKPLSTTNSRLLTPTIQKPVRGNGSNPGLISTSVSRRIPASTTSGSMRRTTSRFNPSALKNSDARIPPKHLTKQVDLSVESNYTLDNEATQKSPAESFKTSVNDAMSYYRGFSNILKIIGTPIDV